MSRAAGRGRRGAKGGVTARAPARMLTGVKNCISGGKASSALLLSSVVVGRGLLVRGSQIGCARELVMRWRVWGSGDDARDMCFYSVCVLSVSVDLLLAGGEWPP